MNKYYIVKSGLKPNKIDINIRGGKIIDFTGRKGIITFYKKIQQCIVSKKIASIMMDLDKER